MKVRIEAIFETDVVPDNPDVMYIANAMRSGFEKGVTFSYVRVDKLEEIKKKAEPCQHPDIEIVGFDLTNKLTSIKCKKCGDCIPWYWREK